MTRFRVRYYNAFSRFYDAFIALHSRDRQGAARRYLASQIPENVCCVLDICTGTATLLPHLGDRVGRGGKVVGLDFSRGMLKAARAKLGGREGFYLVEADVSSLPFSGEMFDAVTCSHAFYELKGETQARALREIRRVLKPGGMFLMMEHDVPANPVIKMLFYIRLMVIGAGRAAGFLQRERELLDRYFPYVVKALAPEGRSKVMICRT
ncbi:MAG: methyltransferase domain-containing protein [Acidobacteriota bacterium]